MVFILIEMIPILFEDEFILAVNKPSGLPSHSLDPADLHSVEAKLKLDRPHEALQLLHRLDTGTSGVLMFAKNDFIFNKMREKFKLKEIKKRYRAWSSRSPESVSTIRKISFPSTLKLELAHHPKSKKRMIVIPPEKSRQYRGKPLPTLSILHGAKESQFQGHAAIEFEVEIVTGVMHQIRVTLEYLGFPLIGDPIYRKGIETKEGESKPRLALHAEKIEFDLEGFHYSIECPFTSLP